VKKGILFVRTQRQPVFIRKGGIYEFELDVVSKPFNVPVTPSFPRESPGDAASFVRPSLVGTSGWGSVNLIRSAVNDVDPASVGFPAGLGALVMLVCVSNPSVVLLFEFIAGRARIRIAAAPELFNEVLFLFQRGQVFEDFLLFVGDDVNDILLQPLLEIILPLFIGEILARRFTFTLPLSHQRRRPTQCDQEQGKQRTRGKRPDKCHVYTRMTGAELDRRPCA
jgi:hypothetical protein